MAAASVRSAVPMATARVALEDPSASRAGVAAQPVVDPVRGVGRDAEQIARRLVTYLPRR
ncbi:hypothetical protein [Streptomyces sp. NPDC058463]|uniref:hypothetical protein n=1 Tax=Streptomyces sp. NPDC058463 TaxID=3346510 RepID=UPI003647B1C9